MFLVDYAEAEMITGVEVRLSHCSCVPWDRLFELLTYL